MPSLLLRLFGCVCDSAVSLPVWQTSTPYDAVLIDGWTSVGPNPSQHG